MKWLSAALLSLLVIPGGAQETITITPKPIGRVLKIPGELRPYEEVEIRARVSGYLEQVRVDRGDQVHKNQVIARLTAPEMSAQIAEAESREHAAAAEISEAEARLASAQATYDRLKVANETPGAVAGIEIIRAEKDVQAARALVEAKRRNRQAAADATAAVRRLQDYLSVTAPFAGTVTERYLHPGALASPTSGPIVRIEQLARLRLVVPVPESAAAAIKRGDHVTFGVSAFPQQPFSATATRISHSVEAKTRTMPVEFDVSNAQMRLAPGMYPEVSLPVDKAAAIVVPPTAVATTTERTFVIRVKNGRAEYVNVKKGATSPDGVEIMGPLSAGDRILKRATDEIREGTPIKAAANAPHAPAR